MRSGGLAIPLIERRYWFIALGVAAAAALILLWMGRPAICTCGEVKLWTGAVQSADNSQHLADWYTPSHIIHGFLFYMLGWLFLRRNPAGDRLLAALSIEAGWEILENSQYIIDRYREATMALGYNGDSVINSMADIGWMTIGFLFARRAPVWLTVAIASFFELLTLWTIRDNLALNVLMLVAPVDAIRTWQARRLKLSCASGAADAFDHLAGAAAFGAGLPVVLAGAVAVPAQIFARAGRARSRFVAGV